MVKLLSSNKLNEKKWKYSVEKGPINCLLV